MKFKITKIVSLLICVCMIISGMVISASAAETTKITFDFGDNGTASHYDGSQMSASKSYTVDGYTLALMSAANCYTGARDAKGNSALKLGASSKAGSFTITVPDDVVSVIFNVAKYKANASKVKINGTTTTLTKASNNGEYDALSVDTSTNKTITFTTVSGGYRCMINSIIYVVETTTGGEGGEDPVDPPVEPDPEEPVVTPDPTPDTELTVEAAATLGASKEHDAYTEGKYYVTGIVASIDNADYGNMTIKDAADETKTLYVYGSYSKDGQTAYKDMEVKHEAGDTVKIYGVIGQYNGKAQMKNAWVDLINDVNPPVTPDPEEPGEGGGETPDPEEPTGNTATITFDDANKRTTTNSERHIWEESGITVTNIKTSSSYALVENVNPVRFYKNSIILVEFSGGNITQIVFDANTNSYATAMKNSITAGGTATASSDKVTFIPTTASESFEFTLSGGQVRMDSITITYETKAPVAEMGDTSATVGANLGIQQSITLKTEDAANKTLKMDFTIGDNTTTVDPVITDGNYTFSFNNIPAHFMTEEITATLYVQEGDDKVEQGTNKYTIAEYGKAILESADYTTEVKKFVANMLTYGAAAQKKANHNTDNLATAGLETLISQFGSNEAPSADDKMSLSKTDSDVRFYSANVKFSDVNNLIIKLNAEPGNLKLFVNGVEKTLNGKEYISEDIKATDYATKFTFELKDGDTVIQTLTYGINSYAYSMYNKASTSTEMKNLASALYAYGVSASNLK